MSYKIIHCSLTLISLLCLSGWIGSWNRTIRDGNEAYLRGNYEHALEVFQKATHQKPENAIAHHNLGTALYKNGNFKAAAQAFQKALLTDDRLNQAAAYYNLGNAQFQLGDFTDAIQAYRHALRLQPTDVDTKYNLQLALLRIQQQPTHQAGKQPQQKPTKNGASKIHKTEARQLLQRLTHNENRLRQNLLKQKLKSGYRRQKDW